MTECGASPEGPRERRRRLSEVFGEVLPETTSDERSAPASEGGGNERWYRENRPPHHGAD